MSQRRHRSFAAALVLSVAVGAISTARDVAAQGPITISLIDVSGDLSSTRVVIENYQKANTNKVKAVNFQRAPALFDVVGDAVPLRDRAAWRNNLIAGLNIVSPVSAWSRLCPPVATTVLKKYSARSSQEKAAGQLQPPSACGCGLLGRGRPPRHHSLVHLAIAAMIGISPL